MTNIEVFRRCYEAVGLGWVYAATTNPTVGRLADRVYMFWAKYRLQVTVRRPRAPILKPPIRWPGALRYCTLTASAQVPAMNGAALQPPLDRSPATASLGSKPRRGDPLRFHRNAP